MENKKSKGISPVIATIIMVAVAIVISIAAAFWLTGLMGAFTTYENIRITAYATRGQNQYTI
ncbi:MAG: archaellin/type IV pilin N-terminal domain-containing protein, partial [Candidatus Methanomethylicia archaeon]